MAFAALLGMVVNLLMLTGPIYMLQVYDRVLGSRSEETLVALSLLAGFLFAMMGLLDALRGRIMTRLGARLDRAAGGGVFARLLARGSGAAEALRGLDTVPRFLAAPVCLALFDLPWVPLFLGALWLFHPWLGGLALCGAVALILLSVGGHVWTRRRARGPPRHSLPPDGWPTRWPAAHRWCGRSAWAAPSGDGGRSCAVARGDNRWRRRISAAVRRSSRGSRGLGCNRRSWGSGPIWCCNPRCRRGR
ncbi:hypothetical protein ACM25N_14355 [Roseovarius sp. C7]|uniref:hypothetical protein n=1 Tax=Roseovarius sp. C7 TaxID=3398643 RepID=UPI0039F6C353